MTPLPVNSPTTGKIHVLILTDEMEVGGTQRQIVHLACALDRARYEVTVAYFCNRSFLADELITAGIPVIEITKKRRVDFGFMNQLVQFLRKERFDIIHCFAFSAELWGALGRRLLPASSRPALITSVRGKYDWYSPYQWRIKRWTALQSSKIIANSHAGGEFARVKMRLPQGAIEIVYNGVAKMVASIEKKELHRNSAAAARRPITALYVGRLVEVKNIPVLLRAMKKLVDGDTKMQLLIAGDGPLRERLLDQISQLNLTKHVELLGQRADTQALMAAADFLVLPSFWEGLSNVILESMMAGTPVIASAVGGSLELVENHQTGLLFASDSDTELADAMKRLATDMVLRSRLGKAAQERVVEQFSIAAMVSKMQDLYAQTVADHRLAYSFTTELKKAKKE